MTTGRGDIFTLLDLHQVRERYRYCDNTVLRYLIKTGLLRPWTFQQGRYFYREVDVKRAMASH
jgi:predicted site-specific integrase-resolvase